MREWNVSWCPNWIYRTHNRYLYDSYVHVWTCTHGCNDTYIQYHLVINKGLGLNDPTFICGSIEGSYGGCNPLLKESIKTKQNIEYNPLEKEERKSCMFVSFLCVHALIHVTTNIFLSKFSSSTPPPPPLKNFWIRACTFIACSRKRVFL